MLESLLFFIFQKQQEEQSMRYKVLVVKNSKMKGLQSLSEINIVRTASVVSMRFGPLNFT